MRNYELAAIFSAQADAAALKEKMKTILTENGASITAEDDWGSRALAYPIKKQSDGYYYFLTFSSDPSAISSMKKTLRLEESLLRYLIILDEHKHVFKKATSKSKKTSDAVKEINKEIEETNDEPKIEPTVESEESEEESKE